MVSIRSGVLAVLLTASARLNHAMASKFFLRISSDESSLAVANECLRATPTEDAPRWHRPVLRMTNALTSGSEPLGGQELGTSLSSCSRGVLLNTASRSETEWTVAVDGREKELLCTIAEMGVVGLCGGRLI